MPSILAVMSGSELTEIKKQQQIIKAARKKMRIFTREKGRRHVVVKKVAGVCPCIPARKVTAPLPVYNDALVEVICLNPACPLTIYGPSYDG